MKYHNRALSNVGYLQLFAITVFFLVFYPLWIPLWVIMLAVFLRISWMQLHLINDLVNYKVKDSKYIKKKNLVNKFLYIALPATFLLPSVYAIKRRSLKHFVDCKSVLNGDYQLLFSSYLYIRSGVYKYLDEIQVLTNDPAYIRRELSYVDNITGLQFEDYCANLLRGLGYTSVRVTRSTADFGLDIIAVRNNETYGFQCKLYNSHVNYKAVQEALAGREYYRLDHAVVVTNNDFTKNALKAARRFHIELWNRVDLINIIKEIKIIKLMNAKQALVQINGTFHK